MARHGHLTDAERERIAKRGREARARIKAGRERKAAWARATAVTAKTWRLPMPRGGGVDQLLRQPHGFELFRRLCLGRIFLVVPGVSGFFSRPLLHEPDAEFAHQLDHDPDAGQHVDGGEELQRVIGRRKVGSEMSVVVSVQTAK